MKALCVKQPWAELIARGQKTLEIRTWTTDYRGPILILSSAQRSHTDDAAHWDGVHGELGATICIVELVDIDQFLPADVRYACCRPSGSEFAWALDRATRVPALPVKGRLGLFDAPRDLLRKLAKHPETPCQALRWLMESLA